MVKCENCGATFDEKLPSCPYCNLIYIPGAEQKYKNDLEQVNESLNDLSHVPKTLYKREVTKFSKIALISTMLTLLLLGGVFIVFFIMNYIEDNNIYKTDLKAQIAWEREYFPILDQYYQEGDYDAIIDLVYEGDFDFSIGNWEHNKFIFTYMNYRFAKDVQKMLNDNIPIEIYDAELAVINAMEIRYFLRESDYTSDEWHQILEWQKDMISFMNEELGFTQEEAQALYDEVDDEGYIDYDACSKYANKIWKRFQ